MRVLVLVKADPDSEAGVMPEEQMLADMGAYNEKLAEAGVLLAGEGLHPSSRGKRVRFANGRHQVIDGPFPNTKELLAGFWIWQVDSIDDAVAWVKRMPNPGLEDEFEIEIRPVFEADDFGDEFTPELREREENLRSSLEQK